MATITALPDPGNRAWRAYESELRMALAAVDQDMREYVLQGLKAAFLASYAEPPSKGRSEAPTLADVNQWIRGQVHVLLLALLYREIELFQLRGNTSTLPASPSRV
jgi:hypothetical protein